MNARIRTVDRDDVWRREQISGWFWTDSVVFVCCIFHGSMLIPIAPGGRLALLTEIVCLEDSVTSAPYRAWGVAPAAWSGIADALEPTAAKYIIKIADSNTPSRRDIVKSGFRESASMRFRLIGFWRRNLVQVRGGATAEWLVRQLQH